MMRGTTLQERLHQAIKEEFPGDMSVKEALFTQGILASMITDYSSQMIMGFDKAFTPPKPATIEV